MKTLIINNIYYKKQIRNLFSLLAIFCISSSTSYSQLYITPGSGQYTLCKGDIDIYTLENPQFGVTYNWNVDPPSVATINTLPNNQVTVYWQEGGAPSTSYTLHVTGGGNFGSISLQVFDIPEPYITVEKLVGCEATILHENIQGNQILDDEDGCLNVCENSEVIYTAHGWNYGSPLGLCKFDWFVTGGLIIATDGIPLLTPVSYINGSFGSTPQEVTVQWGTTGPGSIKVSETTIFNVPPMCPPKSEIICLNIIESPVADFSIPSLVIGPGGCYDICKNQIVYFKDNSTGSVASPINSWVWNFGDNTPVSSVPNPQHQYTDPGTYEVTLTVTNICECQSMIKKQVCVSDVEAPNIYCPSAICENYSDIYHTDAICDPYTWTATGGTVTSGANTADVEVKWDNIGSDGFGYLTLDGSTCDNSCPATITVKVPVILAEGTIDGTTTACSNSYYIFELPAWPATNYEWELINNYNGAVFSSYSQNSHWVEIKTGNSLLPFTLVCDYHNTIAEPSCSGKAELVVDVRLKPVIIAPDQLCINTACTCEVSVPPPPSATIDWIVTKPDGVVQPVQQSSGSNPVVLPASFFNMSGTYTIQASSPANFCDPEPYLLEVVDPPPVPINIYGDEYVCLNYPYTYSTDIIKNSITYWSVTGGTIQGSYIGNSVTVIWNSTTTKTISAYREWEHIAGCASDVYQKNIHHIIVDGTISGDATVCQDQTYPYEIDLGGVLAETYNWKLYSSYGNVGSISPGQYPFQCNVTFLYLAATTSVSCLLTCEVTKCGITETILFPITIEPNTRITSLTANPNPVCSGDPVDFEAFISGAAADHFTWDFGDGSTPTPPCTTNACTHTFTNTSNDNLTFTVSVKAVSGCNGAVSDAVTVVVNVKPEPNAFLWPGDFVLYQPPMGTYDLHVTVTSTGTFTYQWYFDDGTAGALVINGATTANYTVTSTPPVTIPPSITSQGEYWCVVTNDITGCDKKTNIKYIYEDPNIQPLPCTPSGQYLVDYGIENFNISLTGCGQLQATCTTYGSYPGNIIGYNWSVNPGAASYTYSGTETQNNSMYYTFNKAGIYKIGLDVYYENSIPNNPPCTLSVFNYKTVPLVAELKWGIVCNSSNNGYTLILDDYSSVFPGFPVTQWQWSKDGNPITGCGISCSQCTTDVAAGTTPTIELIVDNGSAYPCTTSVQVNVPALPVADYYTHTTYGTPCDPYKSCEGREIEFTNTSTPVNEIIFHEWTFYDNTESHMVNPIKTYDINNPNQDFNIELTVTDKYGCTNTTSKTITVFNNNLAFDPFGSQYSPSSSELCFDDVLNPPVEPVFTGGSPNFSYRWYMGTDLLPNFTGPTLAGPFPGSGAYWVKIIDGNYCYKEINPMPAMISINYSPTTIIDGKQDICYGEDIKLKAVTGYPACSTLYYTWKFGSVVLPGNTNKEITIPATWPLYPGVYSFTLKVEDPGSGCSSVSQPFNVTVHSNPTAPTIDMDIIDCDLYEIQLTGTTSAPPTPEFNWSNGTNGLTTIINHGGVYRLWITDAYGCRNYADIEVPPAPDYYFWRFPQWACYYYCPEDLPKWVDGPMYIDFELWLWSKNGKVVTKNTLNGIPYAGSGVYSVCDPLTIDVDPDGEGPGNYAWGLNNGLCYMASEIMLWDLLDCCDAEIVIDTIYCADDIYHFTLSVTQNSCQNPSYNLAIENDAGMSVVPAINNLTPANLINGTTLIHGEFPAPGISNVWFKIKINCDPPCEAKVNTNLPLCSKSALKDTGQPEDKSMQSSEEAILDIIPNPASSQTNIHYRFPGSGNTTVKRDIKIFDTMGRPLYTINLKDKEGVYILELSKYSAGIYVVELN